MHNLPLPARITAELREQITHGVYRPNEKLPSTRALAHRLGVARGSVVTAYEQLIAEGYLVGQHGSGTRVHPDISPAPP
ncbi:GntR family transcriptional regulator, partial [Corynebacterium confusum]